MKDNDDFVAYLNFLVWYNQKVNKENNEIVYTPYSFQRFMKYDKIVRNKSYLKLHKQMLKMERKRK